MTIYTVESGDSVYSIAKKTGTTPSRIITDNQLENPGRLSVGQTLVLLYPTRVHSVRGGETLSSIAKEYGTSLTTLWQNNPSLGGGTYIYPGQTLNISYEEPPLGRIRTDGYAYPFIDCDVLRTTLPYLTYLSIFSYGIRPNGTLIPPAGAEEELIDTAKEYGTVPLLVLTSLTEAGNFSSDLVRQILEDEALSEKLKEEILETVRKKGYGGVNADFEYIDPSLAPRYEEFLKNLKEALSEEGKILLASLAPKTSASQRGLLYEGHRYQEIGENADAVLLMTYEWGYTYGPPMAVAPLPEVQRVIDYALTEIPREKIFLGIPNYAYDWTLPYVRGASAATSLSNAEALTLAAEKHAKIEFDNRAQTPYFSYYTYIPSEKKSVEHIVWFDDARSIEEKIRLVQKNGLGGIGIWNIMRNFPQLWLVLHSLYSIEKL